MNEPAFPNAFYLKSEPGMTLRDYFAASVAPSMVIGDLSPEKIAQWAYKIADAMMEARK